MKKVLSVLILLFLLSCSEENNDFKEVLNENSRYVSLNELTKDVVSFYEVKNKREKKLEDLENLKEEEILLKSMISKTKIILKKIGLKETDINSFKTNFNNIDSFYAIVSVGLALRNMSSMNDFNRSHLSRSSSSWDCFKKATGIKALTTFIDSAYALYGGEVAAGFAVDAAAAATFKKAGIQAAKALFKRSLGGAGALISVAIYAECKLSQSYTYDSETAILTSHDLVKINSYSDKYLGQLNHEKTVYIILKKDIIDTINNSYRIDYNRNYTCYKVEYNEDLSLEINKENMCKGIYKLPYTVHGSSLDKSTISNVHSLRHKI